MEGILPVPANRYSFLEDGRVISIRLTGGFNDET